MMSSGLIQEWKDSWFCYWNWDEGRDRSEEYVFRPPLEESTDGIVRVGCCADTEQHRQLTTRLLDMYGRLQLKDTRCSFFSSEADYPYHPIVFFLEENAVFSPEYVLGALGAHPELMSSIESFTQTALKDRAARHADDDGADYELCLFHAWNAAENVHSKNLDSQVFEALAEISHDLSQEEDGSNRGSPLVFYCGSEKMNPVPLFVLFRATPSIAIGFYSALVHT